MGHRAVSVISAQRPELLGDDARRFGSLVWTLAVTEWKLKFYGSFLGYLWTLARPFAFFGVIYVVFTQIADIGGDIPNYGVYVLLSMVLFQFFAEATGAAVTSLVARENLLRKMRFPRLVIPLSVVVTALLNLAATLVAVFVFAVGSGITPRWSWLELPLLIALLGLFATGAGMLLATLYVSYRDVLPVWEVASQILFYASPILYVATMVPEDYQQAYMLNPIAAVLTQARRAVIDPAAPSAADVIGGAGLLLIPLAIALGMLALGGWVFSRAAPRIAENL
jgi:ABC-2 type transport system permease protein